MLRHIQRFTLIGHLVLLAILGTLGCVGRGPQISVDRAVEGAPSGGADGQPAGEVSPITPLLIIGSGAGIYQSPNFRGYGSTTFADGKRSQGQVYRMTGPDLTVGRQVEGLSP